MTTQRRSFASSVSPLAIALTGAAILALAPSTALAQLGKKDKSKPSTPSAATPQAKPGTPAAPVAPPSILDDVIKKGRTHDWTLKVSVHVDSYQDQNIYTLAPARPSAPGVPPPTTTRPANPSDVGIPKIIPFKFDTAAVVFPTIAFTATSQLVGKPSAKLAMDNHVIGGTPTWIEETGSGSRYGRWDMVSKSGSGPIEGREIDFDLDIPVSTWETVFDEAKAAKAIWPQSGKWPKDCASSLGASLIGDLPVIDPNSPAVREAITSWCAGKPPQSIPPVQLAKFIASKTLDLIQPSGDGLVSSKTGLLQGFYFQGAERVLREAKGSELEIANVLCSLYRAAGLPARVVIGYDLTDSKGSGVGLKRKPGGSIRTWVEFALVDENCILPASAPIGAGEPKTVWVPVDIVHQRKSSSRAPSIDKPWKFFGNNDETDDVIPIAFHYHPPLSGVIAHGSPCFWGWFTTPEIQQGEQMVRFNAITTPRTIGSGGPAPYR